MFSSIGEHRGAPALGQGLRAAALYAALFLVMGYPLPLHPGTMTLPGDPDTDLYMWTFAWNTHALVTQPLSIFDANIYYPHGRTLAFSENLIGNTIFAAPVLWLTGNPVLALNAVAFASVVLCGAGAWLLARRLGAGPAAAVLAGLVFAYSPARFLRFGQLHLTTIQWIPFSLAFLHTYLDTGRRRDLRLAVAFFTLQVFTSGHGATFLTVAILCILAYRVAAGEPLAMLRRLRDLGVPGMLLILSTLLVLVPYRRVQVELGLRRPLDIDWGAAPESFFASPSIFHLWLLSRVPDLQIAERASAWLFPGFLPLLLAAAALLARRGETSSTAIGPRPHGRLLAGLLDVGILLSLAVGLWVVFQGPIRLRSGETMFFTARDPVRAWLLFGLCVLLRLGTARHLGWRSPVMEWGTRIWGAALAGRHGAVATYAVVLLVCLLLALGPPLGVWPWVYHLPGFNFIRVPSRFVLLGTLALGVLAAFGFQRLTWRWPRRRMNLAAVVVGALMLLEFLTIPLPAIQPVRVEIPAVDRWLDLQPKPFAIAEVPTNTNERLQSTYMLHSMAHWQKTVNGHSGMRTPLHYDLFDRLSRFPDEASLSSLSELGITYVVVHRSLYWPEEWPEIRERLDRYRERLHLEYQADGDRVYRLLPYPPPGR